MKNNIFKLSKVAVALLPLCYVTHAFAAEDDTKKETTEVAATATAEEKVEVIQVRGFASTLKQSLFSKRTSSQTVETISTDDLGNMPDVTITDALARLPGVAADRDRGNASRISIRGMGPRLNMATLNGREIVSGEPSRDVRYEQFPAELINSVQVYKSPTASNVEGGISGLVNMDFVSPLAQSERKVTLSANGMYYDLADELPDGQTNGSKLSFSIVDNITDNLGYAFGIAYQDQPSVQRGTKSWNYNNGADRGDINDNGIQESAPWGAQSGDKVGTNKRLGSMGILEWQATDKLKLKYDLFYSKFKIEEREDQMYFNDLGNYQSSKNWNYNNSAAQPEIITKADGSEQLVGGGLAYANHEVHNATWFQENELLSTGLNAVWEGDIWRIKADVGFSKAQIDSVWVDIISSYNGPSYDLGWSVADGNSFSAEVHDNSAEGLSAIDISNPDYYTLGAMEWVETAPGVWEEQNIGMIGDNDRDLSDQMVNTRVDFERYVDWGIFQQLSFGIRYSDREKENRVIDWQKAVVADNGLTNYGTSYALGGGYKVPNLYALKDWDKVAHDAFGGLGSADYALQNSADKLASWNLTEKNSAAYVMLNINSEWGDTPYSGNIGVRVVNTRSTSEGYEQLLDGSLGSASIDHEYTEVLPSLNLLFNITDDSQIRFGLARTMSRPPLIEMRTGFSIDTTVTPNTASGGNPELDPYIANQVDLGYEYYFSDSGAMTVSLFYKDMQSHIGIATSTKTLDGVDYEYSGPVNGDGGAIKGFEVLYQQGFDFLPAPFDGLGIYANYSFTDSEVEEFTPQDNPYALAGLSKNVGNVTLWYYKEGFEARVGYDYRSEYTGINSWDPSEISLYDAQATVDASISYQFTDNFKMMLQGQNLTNEVSTSYWDNDKTRVAENAEWGRRYVLGFTLSM